MHDASCIGINYAHRFPKCSKSLYTLLGLLLSLYQLIKFLTCTRIRCRDSHCENGLVKCCLYRSQRHSPAQSCNALHVLIKLLMIRTNTSVGRYSGHDKCDAPSTMEQARVGDPTRVSLARLKRVANSSCDKDGAG